MHSLRSTKTLPHKISAAIMPIILVAPIYSDAWTQNHYEGMAKLIEPVPDTADKTINGITCRLYCVRFFYTSVNRRRWVELSAIIEWQDTLDRLVPIPVCYTDLEPIKYRTTFRLEATTPMGVMSTAYLNCPALAVDEVILGIGCHYAIDTTCDPASAVYMTLRCHNSADPMAEATLLGGGTKGIQSALYVPWYLALGSPHTVVAGDSFSFVAQLFAIEDGISDGWVSLKAPIIRLERTI